MTRVRRGVCRTSLARGAFALFLFASACVGGGTSVPELETGEPLVLETEAGLARLEVMPMDADSLVQGENRLLVRLDVESDGTPAELTEVGAFMPAHGHGASAQVVRWTSDTYEVDRLIFPMPGRWEIRLQCRVGGASDEALFAADVH